MQWGHRGGGVGQEEKAWSCRRYMKESASPPLELQQGVDLSGGAPGNALPAWR